MANVSKEQIEKRLIDLVHEYVPSLKDATVTRDTNINTEGFESLNFIVMICTLEDEYGIKLADRVWMKLRTVGEVADTIYNEVQKRSK